MESNIFRINDYSILRVTNQLKTNSFQLIDNTQYVLNSEKSFNLTVWTDNFQSKQTKHRLNKVYSNTGLIDYVNQNSIELASQTVELILRQNYQFTNVFGLLVTIFEPNSGKVLLSQIATISDFSTLTNDAKLLIDGSFWLEKSEFEIPMQSNLVVQVTEIKYSDIEKEYNTGKIGLVYNYPTDFIPLIPEKIIPDYIQTKLDISPLTGILTITPTTSNNKSLETSILEYFEQEVADIKISHVITYGINEAGNEQYRQLRVSNEINKFLPISLGLDLSDFGNDSDIDITVTTEILVNNKLAQRTSNVTVNNSVFVNPQYVGLITHPNTNYPVNISIEHKMEQSVIRKDKDVSEVVIYRPVFTEIIRDTLIIGKKNISFEQVTEPCYLVIHATDNLPQQIVYSKKTSDDIWYFDISEIIPVDQETTYQLKTVGNDMIIGEGSVFKN